MISEKELNDNGFIGYGNGLWTWDNDRILYDIKTQTLFDGDEVYGKHIKLARVNNIDELSHLIWVYFKIDIENENG